MDVLADGFRRMMRYTARHSRLDGSWSSEEIRDIHEGGRVVAVIACDTERDLLVLIRQYRLAAHLAAGRGELLEVVAGGVEAEEDPALAAQRELTEETGLEAKSLKHCFNFMASPGITTEYCSVYLAEVDASSLPESAGTDEDEDIVPVAITLDDALEALDEGRIVNGFLQICLLWLARQKRT